MTITVSAMEARQKFGEILNRVNLVHDQFIVERNGQPLAAIVPISSLDELKEKSKARSLKFLDSAGASLSDEEANELAVATVKEVRAEKRKKNKK